MERTELLNYGIHDKRLWIRENIEESQIREVNKKGYAYLKVAECNHIIEEFGFREEEPEPGSGSYSSGSEPEKPSENGSDSTETDNSDSANEEQESESKPENRKNGSSDSVDLSDFGKLGEALQKALNAKSEISSEDVERIAKQAVAKIDRPKKIKVEIPELDFESGEIEATHDEFEDMLINLSVYNNIWLQGPTGTGKTALCYTLAEALGVEEEHVFLVSCEPFTFASAFWGGFKATTGEYVQGAFEKAAEVIANGGRALVILDEITKLNAKIAGTLNAPLSHDKKRRQWFTDGKGNRRAITQVYIIATANTWGKGFDAKYVGNEQQDASLLNRFNSAKYLVDFNRKLEKSLVSDAVFTRLDSLRSAMIEAQIRHDVTLRDMINIEVALQAGLPLENSVKSLTRDWTPDEKSKVGL